MDRKHFLQKIKKNTAKVAILCGGPSLERCISLNSARSVMDHLGSLDVEIVPIYFNEHKKPYKISKGQLYSNTPSDFDFKLSQHAKELSEFNLIKILKAVDITFPCIHGAFGEDGELQRFLEKKDVPFIGSDSKSCKMAFDKFRANEYIRSLGFFAQKSVVLKITDPKRTIVSKVNKFCREEKIKKPTPPPAARASVFSRWKTLRPLSKVLRPYLAKEWTPG